LPRKSEVLSSNPSTALKKIKEKNTILKDYEKLLAGVRRKEEIANILTYCSKLNFLYYTISPYLSLGKVDKRLKKSAQFKDIYSYTPVIAATWDLETRGSPVQGQARQS
jgi:hypothetical protein